ncbi:MAG: hypothetical protein M3Q97_03330 [Bacteroidota bacterium]|nr:hypothetical protein [Bacteroidota bacterium]
MGYKSAALHRHPDMQVRSRKLLRIFLTSLGLILLLSAILLYLVVNPLWSNSTGTDATPEEAERLRSHVEFLTSLSPARNHEHTASLDKAAAYIFQEFENAGLHPFYQEYKIGEKIYRNVIGRYGSPDLPRLVIGAHYDVFGKFRS